MSEITTPDFLQTAEQLEEHEGSALSQDNKEAYIDILTTGRQAAVEKQRERYGVRLRTYVEWFYSQYTALTDQEFFNYVTYIGKDYRDFNVRKLVSWKDLLNNGQLEKEYYELEGKNVNPNDIARKYLGKPMKRKLVFEPGKVYREDNRDINMFMGYPFSERKNTELLAPMNEFFWEVICDRNEAKLTWLHQRIAFGLQKPMERLPYVLLFSGPQQIGKSTAATFIGKFFGSHFLPAETLDQLFSQFNDILVDKLFIYVDNADLRMSKQMYNRVKTLVSEPTRLTEKKFGPRIMMQNHAWLCAATNDTSEHGIQLDMGDVRSKIFDINPKYQNNNDFFTWLRSTWTLECFQAWMYFWMNLEISRSNLDKFPATSKAVDSSVGGAPSCIRYLVQWLDEGVIDSQLRTQPFSGPWPTEPTDINYTILRARYRDWCEENRLEYELRSFPRQLKDIFGGLGKVGANYGRRDHRYAGGDYVWKITDIYSMRKKLADKYFKCSVEHLFPTDKLFTGK
jgi:hypothetical protein